jgi:hypothetical protein
MRALVVILIVANLLFFVWTRGWLDAVTGLPANAGHEPHKLAAQDHPERVEPLSGAAVADLAKRSCLELGPIEGDAALAAAQTALGRAGFNTADWLTRSNEQVGVWVVATIKLETAEFRARKEATYKSQGVAFEPLEGLPAEQPSLVLTRHASLAAAEAQAAGFERRGFKGLRVLQLQAAVRRHQLIAPQVDGMQVRRLKALKDGALAGGFKACSATASSLAAASGAASAASGPASASSAASR